MKRLRLNFSGGEPIVEQDAVIARSENYEVKTDFFTKRYDKQLSSSVYLARMKDIWNCMITG